LGEQQVLAKKIELFIKLLIDTNLNTASNAKVLKNLTR